MSSLYVLDASAVLAWMLREPGAERVTSLLLGAECLISGVNAAEVIARLADIGRPPSALRAVLAHVTATVVPFDAAQATECGLLRPMSRHLGLSLGDRACLALARVSHATAVTTDRSWLQLSESAGIAIECIRPA